MGLSINMPPTQMPEPHFILKRGQKNQIAVKIAQQIILKGVNDQIAFNIIDL